MGLSLIKTIGGEDFIFDCRRAIYWPSRKVLLAADLHWGKTQYLRSHGVAISDNVFDADLKRLASLLQDYDVRTLLVLGDLIHHEKSLSREVIEKVAWFRDSYPVELLLLKGNHDRYTTFPESWGVVEESDFSLGNFYFSHDFNLRIKTFQFSGHIHPMVKLKSGYETLRLPAFILEEYHCLLPAFSKLTGGQDIKIKNRVSALVLLEDGIEEFCF